MLLRIFLISAPCVVLCFLIFSGHRSNLNATKNSFESFLCGCCVTYLLCTLKTKPNQKEITTNVTLPLDERLVSLLFINVLYHGLCYVSKMLSWTWKFWNQKIICIDYMNKPMFSFSTLWIYQKTRGFLIFALHREWSFPLKISPVNVTKYAGSSWFGHIYCRNP